MDDKKTNDVIGVVKPVVDEVDELGVINPDLQESSNTKEDVKEVETQQQQQTPQQPKIIINNNDQNNKILAGLMGIFFGAFGVHNFIYGYTGKAIAQLLITLLSCFMLSWISAIWGFIEGIMILTDSIQPNKK